MTAPHHPSLDGAALLARLPAHRALSVGETLRLGAPAAALHLFDAGRRIEDPALAARIGAA